MKQLATRDAGGETACAKKAPMGLPLAEPMKENAGMHHGLLSHMPRAIGACAVAVSLLASQPVSAQPFPIPSRTGAGRNENVQCVPMMMGEHCTVSMAPVPRAQRQIGSNWCWAASISMIFEAHGFKVSQERIVRETWGNNIVNMPGDIQQIWRNLSREWTDDDGKRFRSGVVPDMIVSVDAVVDDLASNNPVIIGTNNHAMVITSAAYGSFMFGKNIEQIGVNDPAIGMSRLLNQMEFMGMRFMGRVRITDLTPTRRLGATNQTYRRTEDNEIEENQTKALPPECQYGDDHDMCRAKINRVPDMQVPIGKYGMWTAPVSMVFNSLGYDVPQERMASEALGSIPESTDQHDIMTRVFAALGRDWSVDDGRMFHPRFVIKAGCNPDMIERMITENRPVILVKRDYIDALVAVRFFSQPNKQDENGDMRIKVAAMGPTAGTEFFTRKDLEGRCAYTIETTIAPVAARDAGTNVRDSGPASDAR